MTKKANVLELLTVSDVAKKENVATQMVYKWIEEEVIYPVHKFGEKKTKILIGADYKITANRKKVKG